MLVWTKEMDCRHPALNEAHRGLVEQLQAVAAKAHDRASAVARFEAFVEDLRKHYLEEERDFSLDGEHREHHLATLGYLGSLRVDRRGVGPGVLKLAEDLLRDHILGLDQLL